MNPPPISGVNSTNAPAIECRSSRTPPLDVVSASLTREEITKRIGTQPTKVRCREAGRAAAQGPRMGSPEHQSWRPAASVACLAASPGGGLDRCNEPMKPLLLILVAVLAIGLGVAAIVLGEADDSPGLQGLGLLLVIGAVVLGVRTARRSR
jgi:hypothetical protein